MGAAGIGWDIAGGTPADKAIVKGGASWAGGAAASGLTGAGLTLLSVGTGPVGWICLGVAFVTSAGNDENWQ